MPTYLLAMNQPVGERPAPDVLDKIMEDVNRLRDEMQSAGVWVFSGGLHGPEASTVVRFDGSDVLTTDGPYAEGKEHIGGLTILDAPDLDAALEWTRRLAMATPGLPIEVRPFQHG